MKLVMRSLPFANIIWDAQTSQMSSVFCKALQCFASVHLCSWTLGVVNWLQTGTVTEVLAFVPHRKQHLSTYVSTLAKWLNLKRWLQRDQLVNIVDDMRKNMYICPARLYYSVGCGSISFSTTTGKRGSEIASNLLSSQDRGMLWPRRAVHEMCPSIWNASKVPT